MNIVFSIILSDFSEPVSYIPAGILFSGILTGTWYIKSVFVSRQSLSGKQLFWKSLFILYSYVMLVTTFLSREPGSRMGIDLNLGATWGNSLQSKAYVIENIVMMVPFGMIGPLIWKKMKNMNYCVLFAFLTSIFVEIMQLITQRGHCQTDDVVMNVLGAWIGWGLYWLFVVKSYKGQQNTQTR